MSNDEDYGRVARQLVLYLGELGDDQEQKINVVTHALLAARRGTLNEVCEILEDQAKVYDLDAFSFTNKARAAALRRIVEVVKP